MGLLLAASLLLLAGGAAAIARTSTGSADGRVHGAAVRRIRRLRWRWPAGSTSGSDARFAAIARRDGLLALGLAVLNLFVLPFGTALAIYAFWVLLHNESRALFEPSTS